MDQQDADIREIAEPLFDDSHHHAGQTAAFWFLIAIAFAVFTPCVLMPAWTRYAELYHQQQVMTARVAAMTDAKAKLDTTIDALRTDPGVNERVAIRELGYKRQGEQIASPPTGPDNWQLLKSLQPIEVQVATTDPELPIAMTRLAKYLPNWPYAEVFCESPYRETSIGLSVALMAFAFVLYHRRDDEPSALS